MLDQQLELIQVCISKCRSSLGEIRAGMWTQSQARAKARVGAWDSVWPAEGDLGRDQGHRAVTPLAGERQGVCFPNS